jgi:hypothetical protein
MKTCKQGNLQEIKALKISSFIFNFSFRHIQGGFFNFDSDGEAPRGPHQPISVLTEPTDLQTRNIPASLEYSTVQMSQLRARSGTKHVSKYSVTLNISRESTPPIQPFPTLSQNSAGALGLYLGLLTGLIVRRFGAGLQSLQLDAKTRNQTMVSLCVTDSLETFSYFYPYYRCGLVVFGLTIGPIVYSHLLSQVNHPNDPIHLDKAHCCSLRPGRFIDLLDSINTAFPA